MLLLTSCGSVRSIERVVEVKVPVVIPCPAPPLFEPIDDPVLEFTPDMSLEQLIKDLRASRVIWRDRAKQQEILLDSYRQKEK